MCLEYRTSPGLIIKQHRFRTPREGETMELGVFLVADIGYCYLVLNNYIFLKIILNIVEGPGLGKTEMFNLLFPLQHLLSLVLSLKQWEDQEASLLGCA